MVLPGPRGSRRARHSLLDCIPVQYLPEWLVSYPGSPRSSNSGAHSSPFMHVIVLCCLVAVINSIDRTAMAVAILPMSQTYGWNGSVKGAISSAFNWGHMITNLVGGWAAATFSPKHVLSWGVIVWSLFTLLTPGAAAAKSLPLLLFVRMMMGLGEGVAFPTMQAVIKGWVPPELRSRSLSFIYSGHQIGSVVSLLLSPTILTHGVTTLFYIYGSLGFFWLAIWQPMVTRHPPLSGAHFFTSLDGKTSKDNPSKDRAPLQQLRLRDMPWEQFITSPAVWAIALAHGTFGFTYSICIAWLPTYYSEEFGLDVKQSSFMSVLPWVAMALGTNMSGWTADSFINRKVFSTTQTRKLLQVVGCAGPAACLGYLALVRQTGSLTEAVTLLTLALGFLGAQSAGFASNHTDIANRYAPILYGATNACASLAGSLGVYAVGPILDWTHSWSLVLLLVAAANFVAAAVYALLATSEQLFE